MGKVQFVSKPTENRNVKPIAESVSITPKVIELGKFMISGEEANKGIDACFQLVNTADKSVLVTSVQTSCGCTQLEWNGGVLKPGEKKEVRFGVIPSGWGRGEQKKVARVSFVDGSSIDVTIHGVGQTPVERQRIELSQYSATVELDDELVSDTIEVRLAGVTSYVYPLDSIKITVDSPLVTPKLTKTESMEDRETAELYVVIAVADLKKKLDAEDNKTTALLHCSGDETMEPVEMKIEFVQRELARLDKYLLSLPAGSSEKLEVCVEPEFENDSIHIASVTAEADFIIAETVQTDGGYVVSVRLDASKEAPPGYYTVEINLKNSRSREAVVPLTVHVTAP